MFFKTVVQSIGIYLKYLVFKYNFMIKYLAIFLSVVISTPIIYAQPFNDECESAQVLENVDDWCSADGQFNNVGATSSGYGAPDCWDGAAHDVWFRFTATATAVNIYISGAGNEGTLQNPMVALYVDNGCFGTIYQKQCKIDFNQSNSIELTEGALIVGESYLIRVDGQNGNTGTFKLCIKNFNPPVEPGQDCSSAALLCDKSPFVVKYVTGAGNDPNETNNTCISEEKQTTWFKWIAKNNGTLTFVLTPIQITDDLDFVVFELPNGYDNCDGKIVLRCNATFGGNYAACGPKTGLDLLSTDLEENYNCDAGEDGFVKYIDMVKGHTYALVVNNWSASGKGFSIEFGGTGEFEGPEPDFVFDPPTGLRCEDSIQITDVTDYKLGTIVDRNWSFGRDASPQVKHGEGPYKVFYDSYGWKSVTLTVKSDKGCISTKVKDIWMEPCCEDLPVGERLKIVIDSVKDPVCAGDTNGVIYVSGLRGDPYYRFSVQDTNFNYNPIFHNLGQGTYKVYIVDKKGCRDSVYVDIVDPEKLIADAGPDQQLDLGDHTFMNGDYFPRAYNVTQQWIPNYNLVDSSDFETEAFPYVTTTYTLRVVQDETGCVAEDDMTIFVNTNRKVRIPNVFTPNGDGMNEMFTAYNVKAATGIDEMKIYDRWGELIYEAKNINLGDESKGWDGTFKGQKVNPGVYVYLFMIRFLDDEVIPFAGDITVLR